MSDEDKNNDIKESNRNVKNSDKAAEIVKEMKKKIIKSEKHSILWLAYQQGKIFETFKANNKFINMVKSEERRRLLRYLPILY